MPTARRPSKRCHLFTIPPEVRNSIYELLLVSPGPIRPNVPYLFGIASKYDRHRVPFPSHETVLALARTCRLLHDEVVAFYFGSNTFSFSNAYDLYRYLYMIGEERRTCIKRINILAQGDRRREAFELLGECIHLQKLYIGVNYATTEHTKHPQKNLWSARGVGALRRIRGLPDLDLRVREVSPWNPWSSTQIFEKGISNPAWPFAWPFACLSADHIAEFERGLKEEIGGEKNERKETKGKETDEAAGEDESDVVQTIVSFEVKTQAPKARTLRARKANAKGLRRKTRVVPARRARKRGEITRRQRQS